MIKQKTRHLLFPVCVLYKKTEDYKSWFLTDQLRINMCVVDSLETLFMSLEAYLLAANTK